MTPTEFLAWPHKTYTCPTGSTTIIGPTPDGRAMLARCRHGKGYQPMATAEYRAKRFAPTGYIPPRRPSIEEVMSWRRPLP